MNKTAIVITTINVPKILEDIGENVKRYKHEKDVSILIIGDKKTPLEIKDYCKKRAEEYNLEIEYLGIEDQEKIFADKQELLKLFPYNTPDRVILGCMLSYLRGCDRVIADDDDNFPTEHDFIGFHSITGEEKEINLIRNGLGWFNVHNALIDENNIPFYPRGYPWSKRLPESKKKDFVKEKRKVMVNQGLVLEDPDIDAISRLFWPIRAIKMNEEFGNQFGLYPGIWSPFNFQNTCLAREMIPLYYRPISTRRNADIWTAYVFNKLAEYFGDVITFGQPLVRQLRNKHDLWEDLETELINNRATDTFITLLRNIKLSKKTYFEALGELISESQKELKRTASVRTPETDMIENFFIEYANWYNIVSKYVDNQ